MITKLIICQVTSEQRDNFSLAQQAWQATSQCLGFAGQIGGWEVNSGNAVIIAQWQSQAAVTNFMRTCHDQIAAANNQAVTYSACQVQYFDLIQAIDVSLISAGQTYYLTISNNQQPDTPLTTSLSCTRPANINNANLLVQLESNWLIAP
ncbi:MAG: DUF4937 domain-containing protein [Gammaproteobacteria bacterium]|nr:DUF4937 domain-containing protein [Gammaproteobacteria bacterium]